MAIDIVATTHVEGFYVDYSVTGLVAGTKYDVYRLQRRYVGLDDATGLPLYDFEYPDRLQLWSALAHRIGWTAPTATVTFRDFEAPLRPHSLYIVETSKTNPSEWYNARTSVGDYDRSQGVLDDQVIHLNRELAALGDVHQGAIILRSTYELNFWTDACVYDMTVAYNARGAELPVLGRQYATYVSDTREARRGTLTLVTRNLADYYDVRRIAFPSDGVMRPVVMNAGGDPTMLLDDMRCMVLGVSIDQGTQHDADLRFIGLDYVEVTPADPLIQRVGDNDNQVTPPYANFSLDKTTVKVDQPIVATDTSTGQYSRWDWTLGSGSNFAMGKATRQGPLTIRYKTKGKRTLKLRVAGTAGASTRTRIVTVT